MANSATARVEHVLVVPTSHFHAIGHFQGFSPDVDRYLAALLVPERMSFRPRDEVEQDPGFKQLIPYAILCYRDAAGALHLFQYTRGSGQGEGRLHRKRSIGIGGHISAEDQSPDEPHPYYAGLRREVDEEVVISSQYRERCIGLINDDETDVGRVHLGVVHCFDLEQPRVAPREDDLLGAGFQPIDELLADLTSFETWSQIGLRALQELLPRR